MKLWSLLTDVENIGLLFEWNNPYTSRAPRYSQGGVGGSARRGHFFAQVGSAKNRPYIQGARINNLGPKARK